VAAPQRSEQLRVGSSIITLCALCRCTRASRHLRVWPRNSGGRSGRVPSAGAHTHCTFRPAVPPRRW
jgi:hypothetical protein